MCKFFKIFNFFKNILTYPGYGILQLNFGLDPDCNLIRTCRLRQPDYCLQYMVRYERDVIGQMEALNQLPDYPTENTVKGTR